jgi:ABC-2 type transport system ATP-binding protein
MYTDDTVTRHGRPPVLRDETLVAVSDVTKWYERRAVVDKLSLFVQSGEVFGLVGSNGSGKTTTLRILSGILKPDDGHGQVLGCDLVNRAADIRERVGYMSQALSLYTDLSVFDYLRFRARVYGLNTTRAAAERAIDDFELSQFARTAAGRLSGGWARRLQFAAALDPFARSNPSRRADRRSRCCNTA